jgi:hypothetical protein
MHVPHDRYGIDRIDSSSELCPRAQQEPMCSDIDTGQEASDLRVQFRVSREELMLQIIARVSKCSRNVSPMEIVCRCLTGR